MMKEYLKHIHTWIIRFVNTMVSFFTMCVFSSYKTTYNIKKCRMKNERNCFVLANGPSLKIVFGKKELLQEIMQSDVVAMNNFANSEYFRLIKPKYYVLLDPLFYDEEEIQKRVDFRCLYNNLHHVDWDMTIFLVYDANIKVVNRNINNANINVVQFNGTKIVGFDWFQNLCYKNHLGLPSSRNVVIPALQLMINLGYKRIYLYGAEFSWTKNIDVDPRNNKVYLNNRHFYQTEDILYYDKGWYKWYLQSIVEMIDGVDQVAKYAQYRGVKIINRTKGSFIDAFEYENPDKIVNQ